MAYNPSPKVSDARRLAKKYDKEQVIIFFIDRKINTVEYASYGKNKFWCEKARDLANKMFDTVE